MRVLIQFLMKWMAKFYLLRTKPLIIVIAGTTGRGWVKNAICDALKEKNSSVRTNRKNFNAEIGLPLSILGLDSLAESLINDDSIRRWRKIFLSALKVVSSQSSVINYLVLEMAVDRPRNINYLLSIVKPKIAVFTTVTMIYQENFDNLDEIAREYSRLIRILPRDGLAILNYDDERIRNLETSAHCRTATFGFLKGADFWAGKIKKNISGQSFEIVYKNGSKPVKINRFGEHHICAKIVGEIVSGFL